MNPTELTKTKQIHFQQMNQRNVPHPTGDIIVS